MTQRNYRCREHDHRLVVVGFGSPGVPADPLPGATDDLLRRRLTAGVTGAGARPHLVALQRIADENGGHRASPGPGYDVSVDYVVAVLRAVGYDVETPGYLSRTGTLLTVMRRGR